MGKTETLKERIRDYLNEEEDTSFEIILDEISGQDQYGCMPRDTAKDYCWRILMNQNTEDLDRKYDPTFKHK